MRVGPAQRAPRTLSTLPAESAPAHPHAHAHAPVARVERLVDLPLVRRAVHAALGVLVLELERHLVQSLAFSGRLAPRGGRPFPQVHLPEAALAQTLLHQVLRRHAHAHAARDGRQLVVRSCLRRLWLRHIGAAGGTDGGAMAGARAQPQSQSPQMRALPRWMRSAMRCTAIASLPAAHSP